MRAPSGAWFLLNASADVRSQLEATPDLWPAGPEHRQSPIAGCLLTDAEIDHASGLLQLREGSLFAVYSTETVRRWLTEHLPVAGILSTFADRPWPTFPLDQEIELTDSNGLGCGLGVTAFETGEDPPRFVPASDTDRSGAIVGLKIRDHETGGVLLYAPGVEGIHDALRRYAEKADAVLLDGTFFTDDEPKTFASADAGPGGNRTATEMGHVPITGANGTLDWFAGLTAKVKSYIHINNTNPVLNELGPERQRVDEAGITIANDGDTFEL